MSNEKPKSLSEMAEEAAQEHAAKRYPITKGVSRELCLHHAEAVASYWAGYEAGLEAGARYMYEHGKNVVIFDDWWAEVNKEGEKSST